MGTCDKHRKQPAWGYSTCAGCEVEHQRDNIKALTAERDRYREALEMIRRESIGASYAYLREVITEALCDKDMI